MLSAFFAIVGLDNVRKPLHFSVAAGSYFFHLLFLFHTARQSVFVFQLRLRWTKWLTAFLSAAADKIIPGFAVFAFFAAVFGGQC